MIKKIDKKHYLTGYEVAALYNERTGGKAQIRPMQEIFNWAKKQPDIRETKEGYLIKIKKLK